MVIVVVGFGFERTFWGVRLLVDGMEDEGRDRLTVEEVTKRLVILSDAGST